MFLGYIKPSVKFQTEVLLLPLRKCYSGWADAGFRLQGAVPVVLSMRARFDC